MEKTENCCHDGHRDRLRKKFSENGPETLENHELIELLLYYCIYRRNTNPIAHAMMEHFGSLENVLSASPKELAKFDYMTEKSAVLFNLVLELNRRCGLEREMDVYCYDTLEKVGNFLTSLFYGKTTENLYLLMFDGKMRMLDCVHISEGSVNSTRADIRKIVECAITAKASNVIVAHNHPGGLVIPSKEDIMLTRDIENLLDIIDIRMLTHIIVADKKYAPINHIALKFI